MFFWYINTVHVLVTPFIFYNTRENKQDSLCHFARNKMIRKCRLSITFTN